MDAIIEMLATVAMPLLIGGRLGLVDRAGFHPRWLLAAAALVVLHDVALTRAYRALPNLLPGSYDWEGKLIALGATLAIAALPAFGWRRAGLTLVQAPGSLRPALAVALVYCLLFLGLALLLPNDGWTGEDLAFQLTLPGLEEEVFYRGILLLALDRALAGCWRFAGVDWGWGAVLSCALFGLAHAFGYRHGTFEFDPGAMAGTALPSFVAVWLRLRTGSIVLPILLHDFGNTVTLVL